MRKNSKSKKLFIGLSVIPAVILFFIFMIMPTISVFWMSLFKWGGLSNNKKFVGLNNFIILFKDEKFIENNSDRCYHCKKEVFKVVKEIAAKHNIKYVLDGTNLDDLSDFRPGLKALEELNIISPLKECGLTKDDIRQLSKDMELNTHNKPAFACLATRIPYGTKITKELLKKIEKSEEYLISVGFKQFRVRAHNDIARIEVGKDEIHKFFNEDLLNKTNKKLKEIGFKYVTLDMAGYEMGSMNK